MPPEKTVGGRERNQPETGAHAFPQLKMNLGPDWDGQGFSIRSNQGWEKLPHYPPRMILA